MKVALVAFTQLADASALSSEWASTRDLANTDPDVLAEGAGRQCYKSWSRPNEKTRSNADYLKHILEIDHTSIMEHSTATFRLTGVSRNLLVELTRHRHLSPSVVSQRYVDESFGEFIVPPEIEADDSLKHVAEAMRKLHAEARQLYSATVDVMMDRGYARKNARQAARAILPGGHETEIIVTGNIRAWRHVIKMRYSLQADVEIREMARQMLMHLRQVAPNQVQDIPLEPRD